MRKSLLVGLLFSMLPFAAMANTYAHFSNGQALDPQVNASKEQYLDRYTDQSTAGWTVVEGVPDGVQHNSKYSGSLTHGSNDFMNPSKYVNPDNTDGNGVPIPEDEP